ncbi:MAG: hypothetical protein ACREXS_17900 [Gammaproteobacteria bacterium]
MDADPFEGAEPQGNVVAARAGGGECLDIGTVAIKARASENAPMCGPTEVAHYAQLSL